MDRTFLDTYKGAKRTNIDNFLSIFELRCKRPIFQDCA